MKELTADQAIRIKTLHTFTKLLNLEYKPAGEGEALNDFNLPYVMENENGDLIHLDSTGLSYLDVQDKPLQE